MVTARAGSASSVALDSRRARPGTSVTEHSNAATPEHFTNVPSRAASARRLSLALGMFAGAGLLGAGCGDMRMPQMEPRTIAGTSPRTYDARGEGEVALAYLAEEA